VTVNGAPPETMLPGQLQIGNDTASAARGIVRFGGVAWNRELAPGASTLFGFCANR
jgi:cellulase/cellobiase CelA1